MATSRCTPSCATTTASPSRSRSVPRLCTTMRSTEWRRIGPTKRQAARAMQGVRPPGNTTPRLRGCERDLSGALPNRGLFEDRIYVLTPDAAVVELPQGATPVDFAYAVHTSVGHRCRGARVDGAMVPLNTPLQNGQTVEISTVKEGRPSRDWLNAELERKSTRLNSSHMSISYAGF